MFQFLAFGLALSHWMWTSTLGPILWCMKPVSRFLPWSCSFCRFSFSLHSHSHSFRPVVSKFTWTLMPHPPTRYVLRLPTPTCLPVAHSLITYDFCIANLNKIWVWVLSPCCLTPLSWKQGGNSPFYKNSRCCFSKYTNMIYFSVQVWPSVLFWFVHIGSNGRCGVAELESPRRVHMYGGLEVQNRTFHKTFHKTQLHRETTKTFQIIKDRDRSQVTQA